MAKFDISITKTETTTWTTSIEISAKDEEAASEKAETLLADDARLDQLMNRQKAVWEGDTEEVEYEIDEVSEA